jgi:hypothetical protein
MTRKKKLLLIAAGIAALCVIGTAINFSLTSPSGGDGSGESKTPLGGLLYRASAVSRLKEQMGDLKGGFYPAMMKFAQAHQDELPKTIVDLRPYLPKKLAYLDDEHWELLSTGKITPLVNGSDASKAILLQQKNLPPDKAKIIVYADGHIEYKK